MCRSDILVTNTTTNTKMGSTRFCTTVPKCYH